MHRLQHERDPLQHIDAFIHVIAPEFFTPRVLSPAFFPAVEFRDLSFYDISPLKATLERLVDFDRINAREMRFTVGATNVKTGKLVQFDNTTARINPPHVMASGSLPPGFPATEIDGEFYWDGGTSTAGRGETRLPSKLTCGMRAGRCRAI
jgi:hypothetical protein